MQNLIVGTVVGIVIGIVVGTTVVAPRLQLPVQTRGMFTGKNEQAVRQKSIISLSSTRSVSGAPKPSMNAPAPRGSRWRMASAYGSSLADLGTSGKRLESKIAESSGNHFKIKFYEPGTLVESEGVLEALRSGAIEAIFATPELWSDMSPALSLYSGIPFGPPIQEYLAWLHGEGLKLMEEHFAKLGLHAIACGLLPPVGSGWFRKPVPDLNTLKKLKIGMTGLGARVLQRLGAEVTQISEADIFIAFERGLIDGAAAAQPSVDLQLGLHKMARHYYFPGWHKPATLLTLVINAGSWQSLPTPLKAQLKSICGDNITTGVSKSEYNQFNALKELTKSGAIIDTWSPEILTALRNAWQVTAAELSTNNSDFARVWSSLQRFRNEYEIWREIGEPR
ncbi:MAG: hypothetical protein CBB68_02980 [Rhodospirillaceae bacterium TMED8]|nr:C4-dicarboxylate ABC transporter [Magnetovibrio sp.]OUT52332.1 MAG: hypothetical protein CBB68_02980 [Rhodospirillaceae bacterium TMED8]|tara:strand:+ start:619 stop:1800 length:1182 start_codon:yes stop_codon:yes gene_type:complete